MTPRVDRSLVRSSRPTAWLAALALSGCYGQHSDGEIDAGVDAGRDAAPAPDAGGAGIDATVGIDAGPPLPREPPPDPGPAGRPSDGSDAGAWEEPPVVGAGDPCCVMGEPIMLPDPWSGEGVSARLGDDPPRVGWGPSRWGVSLAFIQDAVVDRLVLHQLEPNGTPIPPVAGMDLGPIGSDEPPVTQAVHWAAGRWAIPVARAVGDRSTRAAEVISFDAAGHPAARVSLGAGVDRGIDVAYVAHGDVWVTALTSPAGVELAGYREEEGLSPVTSFRLPGATWLRGVGMSSRAVFLVGDGNPLLSGFARLLAVSGEREILGELALSSTRARHVELTSLRDFVVTAIDDGAAVAVQVIDPFTMTAVTGPMRVTEGGRAAIGLHGSDKWGVAGVCWAEVVEDAFPGTGRVRFGLVGPDGLPRGTAVTVAEEGFRGRPPNCVVGSDDLGFLVLWWPGSGMHVRRIDVAQ